MFTSGAKQPIRVLSDCEALDALESRISEDKTGRRQGWSERLLRFRYNMKWTPREQQRLPDALANTPSFREAVKEARADLIREEAEEVARRRGGEESGKELKEKEREVGKVAALEVVGVEAVRRDGSWWREAQMKDKVVKELMEFKEGKEREERSAKAEKRLAALAAGLEMQNGVLGKLFRPDKRRPLRAEWEWHPWVPDVEGIRRGFFDQMHVKEGGHMRFDQTYERLRSSVFWPGMWNDCLDWCKACTVCDMYEPVQGNWGPLQPRDSERLRGKTRVAIDIAGPFEKTPEGYLHSFHAFRG